MYFLVSVGILTLFVGESAAQNSYFPLAVGNRWLYKCTNVIYEPTYFHDAPVCLVSVDSTGRRSGDTELQELAITDTMRISPDSSQKGVWITTGPWSEAPDGTLYYLMEGEILQKIGIRPSENLRGQWYDALLIREARTRGEVYGEEGGVFDSGNFNDHIENLIVVGGVRNGDDGQWLLFEKDVPFWHLPPGGGTYFWNRGIEVGEEVQIWYRFSNSGFHPDPVQVPAGFYSPVISGGAEIGGFYSSDGIFVEVTPLYGVGLFFAEETGIVRISGEGHGLDLVSFVRGSNHQTTVETVTWGYLKREIGRK